MINLLLMLGGLLLSTQYLNGQTYRYSNKPLRYEECSRIDEIVVKLSKDTSGVYIINYTSENVNLLGYNNMPDLKLIVKNKNNEWLKIDNYMGCGTGFGYSVLDKCSYTYSKTLFHHNFSTNYQPIDTIHTSLKYCIEVDSLDICTKEIAIYLERHRILPWPYSEYKMREWGSIQGFNSSFLIDEEKERQVQLLYNYLRL